MSPMNTPHPVRAHTDEISSLARFTNPPLHSSAKRIPLAATRALFAFLAAATILTSHLRSDTPTLLDPNLEVQPVVTGLSQPIGIVFLGTTANDFLVLEKATGIVRRVINGVAQPTPVLDLA